MAVQRYFELRAKRDRNALREVDLNLNCALALHQNTPNVTDRQEVGGRDSGAP
jgi:hypothetical protein